MRRDGAESVAEAARRRLELMARELEEASDEPSATGDEKAGADRVAVRPAGRHLRRQVGVEERLGGWVDDRLPMPLRGRLHLGARELTLVVLMAAVGLVLAALSVLRSSPADVTAPAVAASSPLLTPAAVPSSSSTAAPGATPRGTVVVDVTGRVRRPGVVTLPAGSRVVVALRRAGGARPHTDLTSINLAAVLTDGQQIVVGAPGQPGVAGAAAGAAAPAGEAAGPLVDLNAASESELESLPGVGPVTAQKILAWRTAHGAFSSLDELLEVDGIGPKTLAELAPHLTL
jgi:competence protein ComEA